MGEDAKSIVKGAFIAGVGAAVAYLQTAGTSLDPQVLLTVTVAAVSSSVFNAVRKRWNWF